MDIIMMLYMPVKVFCEENCVSNHKAELAALGSRALIVTGRTSSKINGSLDDVTKVLEDEGKEYVIFNEIEENPSIETVMKATAFGIEKKVDFVIGIGGGSPMDAAKAIAMMIANPDKTEEVLYKKEQLLHLPLAEVPTTAGTGSEVTPYAILTIHKQQTKKSISHKIYAELALMDPKYLYETKHEITVNTAVDTLAHLVESYINTNTNEFNRIYSAEGLRVWAEIKDNLLDNTLTKKDYEKLMMASMLGGMAIAHTATSLPHGLSYPVTYTLGVPHGKAVGIFLTGYLAACDNEKDKKNVQKLLGFEKIEDFSSYLKKLLGEVVIPDSLHRETVDSIMNNKAKLANCPFNVSYEAVFNMLQK